MRVVALASGAFVILMLTTSQSSPLAATQAPPSGSDANAGAQSAVVKRTVWAVTPSGTSAMPAGSRSIRSISPGVGDRTEVWEKVILKLRTGLMPPAGRPRPEPGARAALVGYLEGELDRHGAAAPNPGRTEAFHRLNRAEYQNAIRDLLGLELDIRRSLPSDDASFGFDNIGGVLKISQSRLEQYLTVARRVSRTAIGSLARAEAHEYRVAETTHQYEHTPGLPFGTRGGLLIRHYFPQDGAYEFQIDLLCRVGGECDGSMGYADEHRLLVLVDGEQVQEFVLEPRTELRPPTERVWRTRVPLKAGAHAIGVTFAKGPSIREVDSAYQRFLRPFFATGQPHMMAYQPFVDAVRIVGPFESAGPGQTPTRARILTCDPAQRARWDACARTILRPLARRAYRRPVTDADVEPLMTVYQQEAEHEGFERGIGAALEALLVSPDFLYRVERDPAGVPPGTPYRLSDLELASRLSFFLWSSLPDDELLTAAERGRLKDPSVLDGQVRRMLRDPRSDALIENFAGQWLQLRNLEAVRPDLPLFPNFDDSLRVALRKETELLFATVLRENRPVGELLTADYTFVNERLARHYGMPQVYGDEFRRVALTDEHRRGLLGQASILTVTSRPNRTSPVLRGQWVLENVLGAPAPEPPPDVPSLQENSGTNHNQLSVRERLAKHRASPTCAGCHAMLDPPGFALENFDATGQWRERDESATAIDASGVLPDGTRFNGLGEFRATLLKDPEVFASTVTRKLLTYALGRGLESDDMPAVRRIVRATKPGVTLSAIVTGIVHSVPFQMRRTAGGGQ